MAWFWKTETTLTGEAARKQGDELRARNAAREARDKEYWDDLQKLNERKAAQNTPASGAVQQAKDTYAPQQSTEQTPKTPPPTTTQEGKGAQESPADVNTANAPAKETSIDVIKDYDWTSSVNKQQLQEKIPFIRLKEYKITADNAINAIAAGVFAWSDMQKAGANAVGKMSSMAGTGITDAASMVGLDEELKSLLSIKDTKYAKLLTSEVGALGNSIERYIEVAKQHVSKAQSPSDFGPEGKHLMDVYGGLYARESTGRTYTFPYYDNDYFTTNNAFQDTTTIPLIGSVFDKLNESAQGLAALVEPGVYVQRPKYYNFSPEGNQFSFAVTLYNTITPMAHLKNSQLIQQLILNNLPRRKTKVVVEPPCIYEVLIPGKAFYPYCFITDLRVLHVGTKRLIDGEIVPDAFELQITIKSLVSDANNFYEKQMQHHGMTFPTAEDVSSRGDTTATPPSKGTPAGESGAQRAAVAAPANQALSGPQVPVQPGDEMQPTETGQKAAAKALELAESNARLKNGQSRDGQHCAAGVKTALYASGAIKEYPGSNADVHAKNSAGWLTNNGYTLTNITDPKKAPIGAVTVYDSSGSGHIDIKSVDKRGNVKYVSDVVRDGPAHMPVKGVWVKK